MEFNRVFDGIPVVIDEPYYTDDMMSYLILGDVMQLYMDDAGVLRADGFYRSYAQTKMGPLKISLDKAIDIVQENMDYIASYPDDGTAKVSEIGLCYRPVQTLPTYDNDVNARVEARLAWRFASGIKRNGQNPFVIFIDAITGEVLSR